MIFPLLSFFFSYPRAISPQCCYLLLCVLLELFKNNYGHSTITTLNTVQNTFTKISTVFYQWVRAISFEFVQFPWVCSISFAFVQFPLRLVLLFIRCGVFRSFNIVTSKIKPRGNSSALELNTLHYVINGRVISKYCIQIYIFQSHLFRQWDEGVAIRHLWNLKLVWMEECLDLRAICVSSPLRAVSMEDLLVILLLILSMIIYTSILSFILSM